MGVADVLIPAKFIFIITHLLVTVVVISTNEQNIYATIGANILTTSTIFKNAHSGVTAAAALTIVALVFELILLFAGYTLFYDRLNLTICIFHALGTILYAWYNLDGWHWYVLWYLWAILSLIPCLIEIGASGLAYLYYRKLNV